MTADDTSEHTASKMQLPTRYRIVPRDPHAHRFEVRCTVADPDPAGQRFRLPSWIPGSYLIREFARHFVSVRAEANGSPVTIAKEAKDLWRAAPCAGPLTVVADVYAFDFSVRAAYLDALRGYFNGPSVFLCPEGRAEAPCEVEIVAPDGAAFRTLARCDHVAERGRRAVGIRRLPRGELRRADRPPVEMADFLRGLLRGGGATHDVAITGKVHVDLDRLTTDLARICQWQIDSSVAREACRAPFDRYLFQVAAVGDGYGGLEHRTSTSLCCKRDELPAPGMAGVTDDYRRFLGLASHEYFHSWNVKRIKPAAFVPYDLARENYTRQLWAFEGITSYYDDLALVRSGVIDSKSYLELVGQNITGVLRVPGRHVQSLADSSFDAWIKFYRRDENTPNAVVSYYAKGALVALALDLTLRSAGASLDDLMRLLWQRHGETGSRRARGRHRSDRNRARRQRTWRTSSPATCTARRIRRLRHCSRGFGVTLNLRPAEGIRSRGQARPRCDRRRAARRRGSGPAWRAAPRRRCSTSSRTGRRNARVSPRATSSWRSKDCGLPSQRSKSCCAGGARARRSTVHAFRRDELIAAALTLASAPDDTCWLVARSATADDATRARRAAWLGSDA